MPADAAGCSFPTNAVSVSLRTAEKSSALKRSCIDLKFPRKERKASLPH